MRSRDFAAGSLCFALALALAAPLAGQEVRIEGRVIADVTAHPLPSARVTAFRPDGKLIKRVESDSAGMFEFTVAGHSAVRLRAEHIGYKAVTTPMLHFDDRSYFQVEVRLDTEALLLAPLEVVVWSAVDPSPLLDNFRRRVASGSGVYITRADIQARRPMFMSDMLRSVPGVVFEGAGAGARPRINIGRSSAMNCQTQIFVDGLLATRGGADVRLDDLVNPMSVEGIEIYRGLSTVPPEFLNPDAKCGVIAVWTVRSGRSPGGA
jgi:hypothetical protein